jgi:hypothetical protein
MAGPCPNRRAGNAGPWRLRALLGVAGLGRRAVGVILTHTGTGTDMATTSPQRRRAWMAVGVAVVVFFLITFGLSFAYSSEGIVSRLVEYFVGALVFAVLFTWITKRWQDSSLPRL